MGTVQKLRVYKSNQLVDASYNLTLNEQRIVLYAIARLDSRKPMKTKTHSVHAADFASFYGLQLKNSYHEIRLAVDRLFEREIRIKIDNNRYKKMRWVESAEYNKKEGSITVTFTDNIQPYLTMLHKNFSSYELKNIANLGRAYSVRLYEFCKQYEKIGYRKISLDDFKEMLELETQYSRWANLRARVLKPALAEINEHTDISVHYEPLKVGKKIEGLEFVIERSQQQQLAL